MLPQPRCEHSESLVADAKPQSLFRGIEIDGPKWSARQLSEHYDCDPSRVIPEHWPSPGLPPSLDDEIHAVTYYAENDAWLPV